MTRTYTVADLFFTRWEDLKVKVHSETFALYNSLMSLPTDPARDTKTQYGFLLIQILRRLRKNPRLVDRINVEQAVDIFNDLKFLATPWYYFPHLANKRLALVTPDDSLARSSFDQFIYADNEFTSYIVTKDEKHLRRLVVTLYPLFGDEYFDKETVDGRAEALRYRPELWEVNQPGLKPWQLNQVFFTFAHVRAAVMKRCKTLLPAPGIKSEDPEPMRATGPMWYRIKHQAARTGTFGTFDQTGRTNMYSVLDHLEILCQEKPPANGKR